MKQPQTITISAILILNTIFRSIVLPLRCTHFANCWIFKSGQPQNCMTMQMYAKHYRTDCKCIRTIIIHVFSYIMHIFPLSFCKWVLVTERMTALKNANHIRNAKSDTIRMLNRPIDCMHMHRLWR